MVGKYMNYLKIIILNVIILLLLNLTSFAIEPYKTITLETLSDRTKFDKIQYSDSGNYIIATKKNGSIHIWDSDTGNLLKNYAGKGISARYIATNRFGTHILIIYPNRAVILKMKEYRSDFELTLSKTAINGDISNHGGTIIIGYEDGSVHSIDPYTNRIKYEIIHKDSAIISGLKYSLGSERLLLTYRDGTTVITDKDLSQILLKDKDTDNILKSTLSEDSTYIISIHPNGKLKVRSIFDFGLIVSRDFQNELVKDFSSNYFTSSFYLIGENNVLTELVFDEFGNLKENPMFISQMLTVEKMDISPKEKKAAIINNKGQAIRIYDFQSKTIKNLATNAIAEELSVIESGTEAFAVLSNNRLIRFNINTGKIEEIDFPLSGNASSYVIDTDNINRFLGIGNSNGNLSIYKYTQSGRDSNRLLTEFQIDNKITTIDFLSGKQWAIIGTDKGFIYAYDIKTNLQIFKIGAHNGRVNQITTSSDEKYMFSVGDDGYVVRNLLEDNYDNQTRIKNHDRSISLQLSNDQSNTHLITGGSEGYITIWSTIDDFDKIKSIKLINSPILTITYLDPETIINILENEDYIIDRPENEEVIKDELSEFLLISTETGIDYLIRVNTYNIPIEEEKIDKKVDIKIMHAFNQSPEPIRNSELIEDSSFLISVGNEGKINIYDTNYILGYGYSAAGLYKEANIFIDKVYKLNEEANNYEALIRDRQEQAHILTQLGNTDEAIDILKEMNSYLEINPISLDPMIEDTTIQKHRRDENPIKEESDKEEKLESRIIEDYKYVVLKPDIEDYKFITQQQLAYKEYSSPKKYKNIVDNYIQIGDIYLEQYYDYSIARAFYMKAINSAKRSRNKGLVALSYYKFALCTQKYSVVVRRYGMELESNTLDSIANINTYTGLENAEDQSDYYYVALGYETFGDIYFLRKDYLLAEENYKQALEYYENINSQIDKVNILKKVVEVSLKSKDVGKTIQYFNMAIYYSNQLTIYKIKGQLLNEMAKLFLEFGHYRNSLEYARKAKKAFEIHGSTYDMVNNYLIQAQFFLETGDYDNCYKAIQYAEKIAEESDIKSLILAIMNRLAYLEYKKNKDVNKAFTILDNNLNELENFIPSHSIKAETYYLLYLIYKNNTFEEDYIINNYLTASINLAIVMYTSEYDLYIREAEKIGLELN